MVRARLFKVHDEVQVGFTGQMAFSDAMKVLKKYKKHATHIQISNEKGEVIASYNKDYGTTYNLKG